MDEIITFSQNATDFLKALASEKRQEIVISVFNDGREHNITEVSERVHIAQSTASEHLSLMKRAGILTSRKVEKEVYYKVSKNGILRVIEELHTIAASCCPEE